MNFEKFAVLTCLWSKCFLDDYFERASWCLLQNKVHMYIRYFRLRLCILKPFSVEKIHFLKAKTVDPEELKSNWAPWGFLFWCNSGRKKIYWSLFNFLLRINRMQGSFSFAIQPFFDIYFGIIEKFHFNRNNGQIYCNHYFFKSHLF